MTISIRSIGAVAVLVGLSFAIADRGHAELTSRIMYLNFSAAPEGIFGNQVVVPHDGEGWVEPAPAARLIHYTLSVESETTQPWFKIIDARASVAFQGYAGSSLTVWPESQMLSLPTGGGTKLGPKDYSYAYLVNGLRARNTCTLLYNELRAEGMSHDEILAEDRVRTIDQELFVAVMAKKNNEIVEGGGLSDDGGGVLGGHWVWKKVWNFIHVKCLKSPAVSEIGEAPPPTRDEPTVPRPGVNDFRLPFEIQKIELAASPEVQSGVCPMEVVFKIDVFATAAGTAKVRAVTAGAVSPVLNVPVESHWSGAFVGSKLFPVMIGKSGKGGFAAEDEPSGGGPTYAVESDDDVHQGVYWIEAPNGVKSNHVGYTVTCTPPPFEPGLRADDPADTPTGVNPLDLKALGKPATSTGATSIRQAPTAARPDLTVKPVQQDGKSGLRVTAPNARRDPAETQACASGACLSTPPQNAIGGLKATKEGAQ